MICSSPSSSSLKSQERHFLLFFCLQHLLRFFTPEFCRDIYGSLHQRLYQILKERERGTKENTPTLVWPHAITNYGACRSNNHRCYCTDFVDSYYDACRHRIVKTPDNLACVYKERRRTKESVSDRRTRGRNRRKKKDRMIQGSYSRVFTYITGKPELTRPSVGR